MQSKLCLLLYTRSLGKELMGSKAVAFGVAPGATGATLFNRYANRDSFASAADVFKYPGKYTYFYYDEKNLEKNACRTFSPVFF